MLIRAVIFDMDGLMLDTEPLYRVGWKQASAYCGFDLSDDIYKRLVGRSRLDSERVLVETFGSGFPLEKFRTLARKHVAAAFSASPVRKKPGLYELLSFLETRQLPKAVATSTERHKALSLLTTTELLGRFDVVAAGDEVVRGKPSPDLFLLAARRLGIDPAECLVLEDAESGVIGARQAGMQVYHVPDLVHPSHDIKRIAQGIFSSLADVARNLEIASVSAKSAGIDLPSFRTNRLAAFPLDERDREELLLMHQNENVMATLGGVRSEDESSRWMTENLDHWNRHGFGIWIFRDANDGNFVGRGGLRRVEVGGGHEVELGYALLDKYWGVGLATEMAKEILKIGFERFQLESVIALIDAANIRSRRVSEKLGFRFERNVTWKRLPAMMYRLRRREWNKQ
jgi:[ribosomal protein S5]-alanine N-acetyltransferase